ncbi:MAG: hypothetical protein PHX61_02310 [Alphaproteobacteria bacterium]|nr:hypothetical protein [Alphaproteobacteria bacterium]
MDRFKVRLWLCNILIALSLLIELSGMLLAFTATGIIPINIAAGITSIIPIRAASWFVITNGEAVIIAVLYMFFGFWLMEQSTDARKAILLEISTYK